MWCQQCRKAEPTTEEIRSFNKILDRLLNEKSVRVLQSSRTKRARNLQDYLAPRAIAVFPVVASNISKKQDFELNANEVDICNQLNFEATQVHDKITKGEKINIELTIK